jgi:hypothetical protein
MPQQDYEREFSKIINMSVHTNNHTYITYKLVRFAVSILMHILRERYNDILRKTNDATN